MGWGSTFITKITSRNRVAVIYTIETITIHGSTYDQPGDGNLLLSSASLSGYDVVLSGCSIGTEALDLRTLTYAGGDWSFTFAPESASQRDSIYDSLTRGVAVVLKWGLAGDAAADLKPLRLGVVRGLIIDGAEVRVSCADLVSICRTRLGNHLPLFSPSVGGTTTLSSGYTPGNTTLNVGSTTSLLSNGTNYWIRVEASTPFYLYGTGKTASTITGVTSSAQLGTVALTAASGTTVTFLAVPEGDPLDILEQVLTSSGAGTNGGADVLPEAWSYGIDDDYVDGSDLNTWASVIAPSSGVDVWRWVNDAGAPEGLYAYLAYLAMIGAWACTRQGEITARALQAIRSGSPTTTGLTIEANDIICTLTSVDARDAEQPFPADTVTLEAGNGTATGSSTVSVSGRATWPYQQEVSRDLGIQLTANISTATSEHVDRIKNWLTRAPERVRLRVAGFAWSQLCVGDVVDLNADCIHGYLTSTDTGYDGTIPLMVAAIRHGFPDPWVDLDLVTYPNSDAEERAP
jgi:hypothetical protein